jgi:CRISPR-associated protein Csm1
MGRKLFDAEHLALGYDATNERFKKTDSVPFKDRDCFFIFGGSYFIKPLNIYQMEDDFFLLQKLRDHKDEKKQVSPGMVHRFLANYTPSFKKYSESEKLCELCKESRPCEQIEIMKRKNDEKHLYTFSCIAAASSEPTENTNEYKGSQLIGVIKADVDNLGLIFSEGLENKLTISRYLTMSRMLDLFFSGWMYRILHSTTNYNEIYTVYSGGDDLVLVGPWENVIDFAQRLNKEFKRFTCYNDNITLSAGIAVVHPKHPISAAVDLADKYLERAKSLGKDRVTLFDTTLEWSEIGRLLEFKDTLNKGHEDYNNILTTRFIHRLLTYHQMYLDAKHGNIKKLLFHSHMHYDVRRNLKERIINLKDEKKQAWFKENILPMMLKLYQTPPDEDIMNNLKIPVSWTLYKNRKYRKGGAE